MDLLYNDIPVKDGSELLRYVLISVQFFESAKSYEAYKNLESVIKKYRQVKIFLFAFPGDFFWTFTDKAVHNRSSVTALCRRKPLNSETRYGRLQDRENPRPQDVFFPQPK